MHPHPSKKRANKYGSKRGWITPVVCVSLAVVFSVVAVVRSTFLVHREFGIMPMTIRNASIHICFVTSQFDSESSSTDKLFNVNQTVPSMAHSPYYHFFAFSNLVTLDAPGWEVVVKDLPQYSRWTTQSRWPKFQAFQESKILATCQVVFYVDNVISPIDVPQNFQREAQRILDSSHRHPDRDGFDVEFVTTPSHRNDTKRNIKTSGHWIQSQSDDDPNCHLFENTFFGYSIHSKTFKEAANYFWDHYSNENDSWRGKGHVPR
jgi:hypothetical protein